MEEYSQEDLLKLNYLELVKIAKVKKVWQPGVTKKELRILLGAAPKDAIVYDDSEGLNYEQLKDIKETNKQMPGKRIWWAKDDEKVQAILDKNPVAFYKTDLTDPTGDVIHVFDKKVKCICGYKMFKIQREYEDKNPETGDVIIKIDPAPCDERYCPGCGRKYLYHNPEKTPEVAK